LPDETVHGEVDVSDSERTVTSCGSTPSRSATICAATVRCPCPWGVVVSRTVIPPSGETVIVQPSAFPDFGRPRSADGSASVM
jgi:hypothetical protein